MADMREALRKAGLVSKKETKRAKHQERVHRKEVGREGLEEERKQRDEAFRAEQEAKRRRDQELAERQLAEQAQESAQATAAASEASLDRDLAELIRSGVQTHAHGGNRRFFFVVDGKRITFLDLTDSGIRSLLDRRAAIVASNGARSEPYCIVDDGTADAIRKRRPELIQYWGE